MAPTSRSIRIFSSIFYNYGLSSISQTLKSILNKKQIIAVVNQHNQRSNVRYLHNDSDIYSYGKLFRQRREEARRSVLIEIQSDEFCSDLFTYCEKFGKIRYVFHYKNKKGSERHFTLIEFEEEKNVTNIIDSSNYLKVEQIIPVRTTMLWYRNQQDKTKDKYYQVPNLIFQKDTCNILNNYEIFKFLLAASTVSQQIILLYEATKLSEAEIRLRFYTAHQIEYCFLSLFSQVIVLPFGSSVNGFGKQGCDLDLSMVVDGTQQEKISHGLVLQSKIFLSHEKYQKKKIMESVADIMNIFIPGIFNVRKILAARVPIVRFDHTFTGIECDFTMMNKSAVDMSELLHFFGEVDSRVRPLVFTIKNWAQSWKLTAKSIPGPWITNFSLTLLVIFYLQQKNILPQLDLIKADDLHASRENLSSNHFFLQHTLKFFRETKELNTESLEILLKDFFIFFGEFDFETKAISVREGRSIPKPEYSAVYICNPLETNLNVSKNISFEELEKVKSAMRTASWHLEVSCKSKTKNWGIVSLFMDKNIHHLIKEGKFNNKPINFEALFEEYKSCQLKKNE